MKHRRMVVVIIAMLIAAAALGVLEGLLGLPRWAFWLTAVTVSGVGGGFVVYSTKSTTTK